MTLDLNQYESFQRWMNLLKARARAKGRVVDSAPPTTLRVYPYFLSLYCEVVGKDPDQLIRERVSDLKSDDEFRRHRHEEYVTKFINHLGSMGKSSNTIATAVGAVRSFYAANYVPLGRIVVPSGTRTREFRLPTPDELKKIVENAPIRTATWICCQKDCGMGVGDLINLSLEWRSPIYGTIREQLRRGDCPIHLYVTRKKTPTIGHFDTWLGEDAVTMLNEFVDFGRSRIFDVTERTITNDLKKVGIVGGSHVLRKFFDTYISYGVAMALSKMGQINAAGLTDVLVEYWMGHSLGKVIGAYRLPPPELQREIYKQAYPRIKLGIKWSS